MWTHICACAFLFMDLCLLRRQMIVHIYGWGVWNTTLDIYRKQLKWEKNSNNNDKKQYLGYGKVERGMRRKGMSPVMERRVDF